MPTYKTKGELRSDLLTKLGYGGLGAAAGNFVPMADALLEEAQENLYILMPDEKRIRTWDFTTGLSQQTYDFPADCDPDRLIELSTYFEQTWLPVKRGIDRYHDSIFNYINYYPQRYDIRATGPVDLHEQLELWPTDDTNQYTVRIEGYIQLMDFVDDSDRATVDDTLILLYAEAYGKAHLNRPDAQLKLQALQTRLRILRGQQHGEQRYIRKDKEPDPLPRPIVI